MLKGGVLLAAFDTRRPTRDVDLAAQDIANDTETVLALVRTILTVSPPEGDGPEFSPHTATAEVIREDSEHTGVRVNVAARLAAARAALPRRRQHRRPDLAGTRNLRGPASARRRTDRARGLPDPHGPCRKIVTAIQRGIANTRWRDFGDIWSLSRRHAVSSDALHQAITEVADYRDARVRPLVEVLEGYVDVAQARWTLWRRRSNSDHLPEQFETVQDAVITFADPVIDGNVAGLAWEPAAAAWR